MVPPLKSLAGCPSSACASVWLKKTESQVHPFECEPYLIQAGWFEWYVNALETKNMALLRQYLQQVRIRCGDPDLLVVPVPMLPTPGLTAKCTNPPTNQHKFDSPHDESENVSRIDGRDPHHGIRSVEVPLPGRCSSGQHILKDC